MIQISKLKCKYNNAIIFDDLNIEINDGDFFVITGPNGSGKTTLLKAILNQIPYYGDIKIDGVSAKEAFKNRIVGYVMQRRTDPSPLNISVEEYLHLYLNKKEFTEVVKMFNISELLNLKMNVLSGGQYQMVNIVKNLSHNLRYIILDEPNTGLDFKTRQEMFAILENLHQQGITIILITHYLDEISCKVNKIFKINEKKLILENRDECQYC